MYYIIKLISEQNLKINKKNPEDNPFKTVLSYEISLEFI